MYADRVESGARRSVKERLNGNVVNGSTRQRPVTGKRQREDDKWGHDLFEGDEPRIARRSVTAQDLRLKLQKKGLQSAVQSGKSSIPVVRDLREKLSGTIIPQPTNTDPPKLKVEGVKPINRSVNVEDSVPQIKKVANPSSKKKASRKVDTSVNGFLQSLGLEKYIITFQAEEVDMTALMHMTDEDLKAIGVPMGPRKKILLALESKG